jgi:hypothetical protein
MDLNDLIKLAGIQAQPTQPAQEPNSMASLIAMFSPQMLNRAQPTYSPCAEEEVEEADGAGFNTATTRPDPQIMDDPMQSMGSDVDLSLRRYLKAKGDHVTVDENVYADYSVEDVTEAYAAFKEGKKKPDTNKNGIPDYAEDGKGKNDLKKPVKEGTWAIPDTPTALEELAELMKNPIPANQASDLLYHLVGDDSLADDIGEIEDRAPETDIRPLIQVFLKQWAIELPVVEQEKDTTFDWHNSMENNNKQVDELSILKRNAGVA